MPRWLAYVFQESVCKDCCSISHSLVCYIHCMILDSHFVGKANDGSGLDGSWGSASCSHTGEDELQNPGSPPPAPPPCNGREIRESSANYRRRCGTGSFRHPPPPPAPPPPIGTWWQVRFSAIYSRVQGGTGQDRTLPHPFLFSRLRHHQPPKSLGR